MRIYLCVPAILLPEDASAHQRLAAQAVAARIIECERRRWEQAWGGYCFFVISLLNGTLLISPLSNSP